MSASLQGYKQGLRTFPFEYKEHTHTSLPSRKSPIRSHLFKTIAPATAAATIFKSCLHISPQDPIV